jgi:hypothetical protein
MVLYHVELVDDLEHFDVKENGAAIRYGVWKEGSNINFVKQIDEHFFCVLMKEEWKMRLWLAELGRQL